MAKKEDILKELRQLKDRAEAQYVSSVYGDIGLIDEFPLNQKFFTNKGWRTYYFLLTKLIEQKKIQKVDQITMDSFLKEQNPKIKKLYDGFGGWDAIAEGMEIIDGANIENAYNEILRFTALERIHKEAMPLNSLVRIKGKDGKPKEVTQWSRLKSLTLEEMSDYVEGSAHKIFADIDLGEDEVQDMKIGIEEMLKKADSGVLKGLPLFSKILNSTVNGMREGHITMVAGHSGAGKTFFTLCQVLPSVILEKEPILICVNEEDIDKWQQELLIWVIHNVVTKNRKSKYFRWCNPNAAEFRCELIKSRFYQGDFSEDEWELFKAAQEWIDEKVEDGLLKFISFNTFSMRKTIKQIKRFATQYQCKYFIIDTLKLDNEIGDKVTELAWLQLQQNMVRLYNVIKPPAKNVHVWVTYQLNKSVKTRFLDQSALGMSKNVADVVSTLILIRNALESEKGIDSTALKVIDKKGNEKKLLTNKDYMIAFIDKNRAGTTNKQIVWRVDKGKNVMKDIGFTTIAQDY